MTKTIGGGVRKRASTWASSSPVSPGIWMSRKTASTSLVLQDPQRLGRGVAGEHLADPVVLREQVGELVERRPLVVDDQARAGRPAHACTPGANFGHPHGHLGAGAGRGLDDEAELVAEGVAQPAVDVAEPDRVARGVAGQRAAHLLGVLADAVVLDLITHSWPRSSA